jgi:hypothetical protein
VVAGATFVYAAADVEAGSVTVIRWLRAHRRLARLIHRGPIRAWISRRVWAEAEADRVFVASMAQGLADVAAGRLYRLEMRDGVRWSIPNPDWPTDGPQPHEARPLFASQREGQS